MDSQEFCDWLAYDRVDPFGESRADLRTALLASIIANVNRGKNQPPFKIEDFLLDFSGARKVQDWREMQANLFAWSDAHNQAQKD